MIDAGESKENLFFLAIFIQNLFCTKKFDLLNIYDFSSVNVEYHLEAVVMETNLFEIVRGTGIFQIYFPRLLLAGLCSSVTLDKWQARDDYGARFFFFFRKSAFKSFMAF